MITIGVLWTKHIERDANATAEVTCRDDQTSVQVVDCEMKEYLLNLLPQIIDFHLFH